MHTARKNVASVLSTCVYLMATARKPSAVQPAKAIAIHHEFIPACQVLASCAADGETSHKFEIQIPAAEWGN